MTAEERLKRLLPYLPLRARILVYLALVGEAGREEVKRAVGGEVRKALEALLEEGLVAQEGGRLRLALPGAEEAPVLRKAPSPLERLARGAGKDVAGLLMGLSRREPRTAQPLAAARPALLLEACRAASVYPASARLAKLSAWLSEVARWGEELGEEETVSILREAVKRARDPFPYAARIAERLRKETPQGTEVRL